MAEIEIKKTNICDRLSQKKYYMPICAALIYLIDNPSINITQFLKHLLKVFIGL